MIWSAASLAEVAERSIVKLSGAASVVKLSYSSSICSSVSGSVGFPCCLAALGKNALEQHLTRREQLDEQDGASRLLIGRDDVGDVLFVARREHVGVDQVDVFGGRGRDKVASETPDDTPERLAPERQHLCHGVDRDVVVEDLERETVCDRSRDRQLSNSRRAVEEHETRRWPRAQVCGANGADVGQRSGMTPEVGPRSVQQPEVTRDGQEREPGGFVGGSRGRVTRVTAGLDHGNVHAATPHVLRRKLREPPAYAAPLIVRVDADDVDDTHSLVERVQRDGNKSNRASAGNGDEDVAVGVRTARPDDFRLVRSPVWVQADEDVITQDIAHRGEHRCPRAQRELNDRLKVAIAEVARISIASVMATER